MFKIVFLQPSNAPKTIASNNKYYTYNNYC